MTIVGIKKSSFKGSDGDEVRGTTFYWTYPLEKGDGQGCDRAFLHEKRLSELDFIPSVGDEVKPEYNRYGKVCAFDLAE